MTTGSSWRYFVASVALLAVIVALHAGSSARRAQAELRAQLEVQARALTETVAVASRSAVHSNALVEAMIADRLLDNARLIDALLARPVPPGTLERLAARNGLRRVDLVGLDGRPWTPPEPPPMAAMMRAMPDGERPMMGEGRMMPFMWGRRWHRPQEDAASAPAPAAVRDRRFWEGTVFGVAVGATSFPGVIAVHADAAFVLAFREAIGVDRHLAEIGRHAGVVEATLLGPDLVILAATDPARVGQPVEDAHLAALAARPAVASRLLGADAGRPDRFEVVRPFALDDDRAGLLAIAFSTEPLTQAWRRDVRAGALLAGAVLLVGGAGLAMIFWMQRRHLAEVRRLETAMGRRERLAALGDVAAAFAHEVRNPLNAVSVGLQRLGAEFAPEPRAEYARFVELMQAEVRRLNGIVEEFITLARPLPLAPKAFAVDELLHEMAALTEGDARAAGIAVRVETAAGLPPLVGDRDRLKQVLLNLALNGVQAMTAGGSLTLGAHARGRAVSLTVADTGPGIAPEVLPRIFDPYFSTRRDGLGLGLTIVRRIVEAHGGTIEVDSAAGRGTRFTVTLPLAPP